ncbi:MAG: hypothetical protein LBP19_01600 [Treponema sp.]|jgi:hypothetical protein|nr:hypothetical protein [Treponema sp.]
MKYIKAFLIMFMFSTCGIDQYIYLEPVNSAGIAVTSNTYATVRLPSMDDSLYFKYFALYYRIYISGLLLSSTVSTDLFTTVNAHLASDYSVFAPYLNNTSVSTSVDSLFTNRQYRRLALEGASVEDVLDDNVTSTTLVFDFTSTPGSIPSLVANSQRYKLQRTSGNGLFSPVPSNRYFLNTPELNASTNATTAVNADVADATVTGTRYTYVALYIVSTGIDSNFAPVYSAPAFIGVFSLPEQF